MAANAKLKKEEETRHTASVKRKRMTRPRKRLDCGQGRDFFRMAASFANAEKRESDFSEQTRKAPKDVVASLSSSPFLQARYQERSPLFVIKPMVSPHHELSSFGYSVLEKWQRACGGVREPAIDQIFIDADDDEHEVALTPLTKNGLIKNGVQFSPRESAYLAFVAEKIVVKEYLARAAIKTDAPKLSAQVFHRMLRKCMNHSRMFLCVAKSGNREKKLLVERARVFWSHRLQTKALQTFNSAESSICYFHAALRSKTAHLDFLYWLKLDEEKVVLDGDFIDFEGTTRAIDLFLPERLLLDSEALKSYLAGMHAPARFFVAEVNRLLTH